MSKNTNGTQGRKDGFSNEGHKSNCDESKETNGNESELRWTGFPWYSGKILHLLSILPRQRFDLNENTDRQRLGFVKREMSDGVILDWMPVVCQAGWVKTRIAELFYKIETLVIRPLIKSGFGQNESWIELGVAKEILSKVTDQKYTEKEVLEALRFGSLTRIDINTTDQTANPDTSMLCTFGLFNLLSFTDERSETILRQKKVKRISIKPTLSYQDILWNTIDFEDDPNFVKMDSRAIRRLEIVYWNSISEKNNKRGFTPGQIIADDISDEELVELFPLENVTEG